MDNSGLEKHNDEHHGVRIIIRPGVRDDANFIFATWLKGYYYGSKATKTIAKTSFMLEYHKVIENILSKPSTKVMVAALKDDPDVIIGYSVFDGPVLHWVFVKDGWRKMGIASSLTDLPFKVCTHQTEIGLKIKTDLIFDPFLVIKT